MKTKMSKVSFEMTLHDDEETVTKSEFMSQLEVMFDHSKNEIPIDDFPFTDTLQMGTRIRVTFEVVE